MFSQLGRHRRDTDRARQIATELKDRPQGVDLALRDMDCFGGSTRGWANWMLEHSSVSSVDGALLAVIGGVQEPHSRRVAAAWILWRRTCDRQYLVELFRLVRAPGGKSVQMGRRLLSATAANASLRDVFLQSHAVALPLTDKAFSEYLCDRLVGLEPGSDASPPRSQ